MQGQVYITVPVAEAEGVAVELRRLELLRREAGARLTGKYVEVRNGSGSDARADAGGNFIFRPGRGGARLDRHAMGDAVRARCLETAHFSEVNTYCHIDRMADYLHGLLAELRETALPRVVAVVHAHDGCGGVNGVVRRGKVVAFQGGHYRLPAKHYDVAEMHAISPFGEIHLGPGRRRLATGALARFAGKPYRHNAAHNAGIIYHEYGHHVTRHLADYRANGMRPPLMQSNRKVALDEGTCDYFAAVMLGTPHIWSLHRRHDGEVVHRRSLTSTKTMAQYDRTPQADPHINGTIWAAALWDLRQNMGREIGGAERVADLLVVRGLALTGRIVKKDRQATCRARARFRVGLAMLLQADGGITGGAWNALIRGTFAARGIFARRTTEARP